MCFILNSCFVSLRDMHTCLLYHNSCWVHSTVYSATCIHAHFFTQVFEFTTQFTVLPAYMLVFSHSFLSLQHSSQCYLHTCSFFHTVFWVYSTVYSATCIHAHFFTMYIEFATKFTVLPAYMLVFSTMCVEFTTQFTVLPAHNLLPSTDFNYINTKKS